MPAPKSNNPAKPKRKTVDWEPIDKEVRANLLSIRELGRKYNITEAAIRMRMKRNGMVRDLLPEVQRRIKEKLVRSDVRKDNANDAEIVEESADKGVGLIMLHRQDIQNLRNEEQKILSELSDNPTKLHICQYQGKVIETVVGIAVTERAAALQALAQVQHKRIALERQAFSLDDNKIQAGGFTITITSDDAACL